MMAIFLGGLYQIMYALSLGLVVYFWCKISELCFLYALPVTQNRDAHCTIPPEKEKNIRLMPCRPCISLLASHTLCQ